MDQFALDLDAFREKLATLLLLLKLTLSALLSSGL